MVAPFASWWGGEAPRACPSRGVHPPPGRRQPTTCGRRTLYTGTSCAGAASLSTWGWGGGSTYSGRRNGTLHIGACYVTRVCSCTWSVERRCGVASYIITYLSPSIHYGDAKTVSVFMYIQCDTVTLTNVYCWN